MVIVRTPAAGRVAYENKSLRTISSISCAFGLAVAQQTWAGGGGHAVGSCGRLLSSRPEWEGGLVSRRPGAASLIARPMKMTIVEYNKLWA